MLSDKATEPLQQAALPRDAKAGGAEVPVLDPRSHIEVASGGTGTGNDPGGSDKPSGIAADPDYLA